MRCGQLATTTTTTTTNKHTLTHTYRFIHTHAFTLNLGIQYNHRQQQHTMCERETLTHIQQKRYNKKKNQHQKVYFFSERRFCSCCCLIQKRCIHAKSNCKIQDETRLTNKRSFICRTNASWSPLLLLLSIRIELSK